MNRLVKHAAFVQVFGLLSEEQGLLLMKHVTEQQAVVLADIAANVLVGQIKMTGQSKNQLSDYKDFIRCLAATGVSPSGRVRCIKSHPEAALLLIRLVKDKILRVVKTCQSEKSRRK
jgi:hypothetical protein